MTNGPLGFPIILIWQWKQKNKNIALSMLKITFFKYDVNPHDEIHSFTMVAVWKNILCLNVFSWRWWSNGGTYKQNYRGWDVDSRNYSLLFPICRKCCQLFQIRTRSRSITSENNKLMKFHPWYSFILRSNFPFCSNSFILDSRTKLL